MFKFIFHILLISLLTLSACKSRKQLSNTVIVIQDSSRVVTKMEVTTLDSVVHIPESTTEVVINIDTDSSGDIKPFSITIDKGNSRLKAFKSNKNQITIKDSCGASNNRLRHQLREKDSINQVLKYSYRKSEDNQIKEKIITKYKTPWYCHLLILLLLAGNIYLLFRLLFKR